MAVGAQLLPTPELDAPGVDALEVDALEVGISELNTLDVGAHQPNTSDASSPELNTNITSNIYHPWFETLYLTHRATLIAQASTILYNSRLDGVAAEDMTHQAFALAIVHMYLRGVQANLRRDYCYHDDLADVMDKVYTRDLYFRD